MTNCHYIASFYHCCNHLAFSQAWSLNCSADHTATQTVGHSSIDITAAVV